MRMTLQRRVLGVTVLAVVAAMAVLVFQVVCPRPAAASVRSTQETAIQETAIQETALQEDGWQIPDSDVGGVVISSEVVAQVESGGSARVLVELTDDDDPTALGVLGQLPDGSYSGTAGERPGGYLALTVDRDGVDALSDAEGVASVKPNRAHRLELAHSMPDIGAPAAWASGFTGADTAVAVIDTGVDADHPFFTDGTGVSRVVAEACFSGYGVDEPAMTPMCAPTSAGDHDPTISEGPGAALPCWPETVSACGHGTHVAGIAAGRGPDVGGDARAPSGVAPSAGIIAMNVFMRSLDPDDCGGATRTPCLIGLDSDVISALDLVYAMRSELPVVAVNMSLGDEPFATYCDDTAMAPAIHRLEDAGITVVVAAGNGSYKDEILSPACVSGVVSVGSVDVTSGMVSSFSNASVQLTMWAPGSNLSGGIVSSLPGGGYGTMRGTSMAAPHVAGAVAVVRSAKADLTADQVVTVLRTTGDLVKDTRIAGGVTRPSLRLDEATADIEPVGDFELVVRSSGIVDLSGWALDLDTDGPVDVVVSVDGSVRGTVRASRSYAALPAIYPGYSTSHGFAFTVEAGSGTHQVCVEALGYPDPAVRTALRCRDADVSSLTFGTLDPASIRLRDGRVAVVAATAAGSVAVNIQIVPDGPWGDWQVMPVLGIKPVALVPGISADGSLDVFVVGSDGTVGHSRATGGSWSLWDAMTVDARRGLTVGNSADGRIELFAVSFAGAVTHAWEVSGGGFSSFIGTGAPLATSMTAASNRDGRMEVFIRAADGRLVNSWQLAPNAAWSGWSPMGSTSATRPVVVANADGRLEIFATRSAGDLVHSWQWGAGTAWSGWDSMGARSRTAPVVVANADGRLEIFATTSAGDLVHSWQWGAGTAWSGWDSMGMTLPGVPTVSMYSDGRLSLVVLSPSGSLLQALQLAANSPWAPWTPLPT